MKLRFILPALMVVVSMASLGNVLVEIEEKLVDGVWSSACRAENGTLSVDLPSVGVTLASRMEDGRRETR